MNYLDTGNYNNVVKKTAIKTKPKKSHHPKIKIEL